MTHVIARQLLPSGSKALVIFTRGNHFRLNGDGTGHSGNWKLDVDREVDHVVLYFRPSTEEKAEILVARHVSTEPSTEPGRCVVHFAEATRHPATDLNWSQFAETTQNPIRYLEAG